MALSSRLEHPRLGEQSGSSGNVNLVTSQENDQRSIESSNRLSASTALLGSGQDALPIDDPRGRPPQWRVRQLQFWPFRLQYLL